MKKFTTEQDSAANPPERQGEQTPEEAERRVLERRSGETLLDETVEELEEEETGGVEWDGSEAELVADDDAAEYEEQNTGIALTYTLKRDEVFRVLIRTQYTQARVALSVVAALLGLVMAVVFFVRAAGGRSEFVPLGIACLVVVFLIAPSPVFGIWNSAKKSADGSEIRMEIYPDHIEMGGTRNPWEIPLDGTAECRALQELIVLYIGKHLVILPLRCVEPSVLPEVQAMIFAGTRPVR